MHPVGTGPVVLLQENGVARKNASIEGNEVPYVKLQEPGVSHPTAAEENKFLTSSLSPPITLEAACMQSLPAINAMMLGIPELDYCCELEAAAVAGEAHTITYTSKRMHKSSDACPKA